MDWSWALNPGLSDSLSLVWETAEGSESEGDQTGKECKIQTQQEHRGRREATGQPRQATHRHCLGKVAFQAEGQPEQRQGGVRERSQPSSQASRQRPQPPAEPPPQGLRQRASRFSLLGLGNPFYHHQQKLLPVL